MTKISGQARCSNFQFIEVTCSNTDKPLKFCTSPEQITNETLVAAYSGAFLHCDYLEGPPSSSQGKYFRYNETTIWVTYDCEVNFRICMGTFLFVNDLSLSNHYRNFSEILVNNVAYVFEPIDP